MKTVEYTHHEDFHNETAANEILPHILSLKPINSIIDIGCGTGSWLSAAKKLGIQEIFGVDGIKVGENMLTIKDTEFRLHNLTEPLNLDRKFDLAICLEVVEHLPHEYSNNIIDIITQHSNFVLFSAAIPYQTGDHHVNEQWPVYWQQLFEKRGFYPYDILRMHFWDNENIDWWYRQNITIYSSEENNPRLGSKSENVLALVHPELLIMKENELRHKESQLTKKKPGAINFVKRLIKSILR